MPIFNEESVLELFGNRLRPVLDGLGVEYEVVAVDDGSQDGSATVLETMRRAWPELRIIRLRRNAGHQAALTAGLERCLGDMIVTIDADLQDPPEVIVELLATAQRDDADVVYAVRSDRHLDSFAKRTMASLYYRAMRRAAGNYVPSQAGDFRLMSRAAVDALRSLPERHRVYRLLVPWLGFPSSEVTYQRERRAAGVSKYPMSKMSRLAIDSLTSFTAMPLRIATWAGIAGSAASITAIVIAIVAQLVGATVPGWTSVFVAVFFLGAIQLLCLVLLGEYVGRLYAEAQHRPLYFIGSDTADSGKPERAAPADNPSNSGTRSRPGPQT